MEISVIFNFDQNNFHYSLIELEEIMSNSRIHLPNKENIILLYLVNLNISSLIVLIQNYLN